MKVYEIDIENAHIFYGYITENDIYSRKNELSLYRREKLEKAKNKKNAELSALAELILIYGIDKLGIKCDLPLEFMFNEYGKPFLKGYNGIFFNLSHSGDMASCIISEKPAGIDVEAVTRESASVAEKYFSAQERAISEEKGISYVWTRKEAVAKANGRGIGAGIDKIDTISNCTSIDGVRYSLITNLVDSYYISCALRLVFP